MVALTYSRTLLEQLAEQHRHVLSSWRAVILVRRATFNTPPTERRWQSLPQFPEDLTTVIRHMRNRGELSRLTQHPSLYQVTVPYARQSPLDHREILLELHPYATLSHLSALIFHGLTVQRQAQLTVTSSKDRWGDLLPPGTSPPDWEGVLLPTPERPRSILGVPVTWKTVRPEAFFGHAEYHPLGFPIRYTNLERTLIDGIAAPDMSGGINTVLEAWGLARGRIDAEVLVYQVERFGTQILRQRIGFLLEQLGLTHPRLDAWKQSSQRGGSSKLIANEPYAPTYDEGWNLSINTDIGVLLDAVA